MSFALEVMKLAMGGKIKEQIIGIFGVEDESTCINKMHAIIELAETLKVKDIKITVNLSELIKARREYMKTVEINDD